MINLAGHDDPDPYVLAELFIAGIEPVRETEPYGECQTIWSGRLRDLVFHRAWHYWTVAGRVSLPLAIKIYEQKPYGRRDVRAGGHCGGLHPLELAKYVDKDGIILIPRMRNGAMFEDYESRKLHPSVQHALETQGFFKKHRVVDDPAAEGLGFVDVYHIDSQAGLKVFVDTVNGNAL